MNDNQANNEDLVFEISELTQQLRRFVDIYEMDFINKWNEKKYK